MHISETGERTAKEPNEYLSKWQELPLSSVADIRFSNVNKVSQPGEEPVRLCNYTDVYNNGYVTADMDFMHATATRSEVERFGLQVGDVIITRDSETPDDIGIPTVVDATAPDLVCGYHLALLRPNQELVDPTFLAKQLAHHRIARYFGQQANGTTRYGLSTATIANSPLHLPRPESQRSASALMRLVDTHITQTGAVIAKLKKVREGLLHDLLNFGLDDNGQLRDPITYPEQFQDSPMGRIPRKWAVKPLASIATVDRGKFTHRPRNDPPYYGGPYPFIQTGDIAAAAGGVINEASQFLSDLGTTVSMEFPIGTIAVTIAANIGDTAILGRAMYFPDSVVGVVVDEIHSIRWVELSLRRAKQRLDALAPQSAQKNINLTFLRPLLIAVPPPTEQKRCSEIYDGISRQLRVESRIYAKLKSIKSGFQDDLLTGRVRVPEIIMGGAAET